MKRLLLIFSVGLILCSCAKEDSGDTMASIYNRVLDAWLDVHGISNPKTTDAGIVFLDEVAGTGAVVTDSSFVFMNYYCTDLDGEIITSNNKDLDKQMGKYKESNYYGPKAYRMGNNAISPAIESVLLGMKEGAEFTIIIPMTYAVLSNGLAYSTLGGRSENLIYHIELEKVVENVTKYELEMLEDYQAKWFPGSEEIYSGLFFEKTKSLPEQDTVASETTLAIRYIGRMLDGTVFDTNIADSAKFYRMYDADNDYKALDITYKYDVEEMVTENSTVSGFTRAVHELKKGEAGTTFFWSLEGYGDKEQTNIPAYSSMRFDIWVEE